MTIPGNGDNEMDNCNSTNSEYPIFSSSPEMSFTQDVLVKQDEDILGEYLDEYFDAEESDVVSYLFYVCKYLMSTDYEEIEFEDVDESLETMLETVRKIKTAYTRPAPKGVNSAREIMLEILDSIENGIERIYQYLEEEDFENIKEGKKEIEEATEMIDSLQDGIAQQRLEIADILSKIGKGLIKEGEPIPDENEQRISLSDEDLPHSLSEKPLVISDEHHTEHSETSRPTEPLGRKKSKSENILNKIDFDRLNLVNEKVASSLSGIMRFAPDLNEENPTESGVEGLTWKEDGIMEVGDEIQPVLQVEIDEDPEDPEIDSYRN